MSFVYFLGRFHVLVLHLPIGIILAAVLAQWLASKEQHRRLEAALPFLWGASAVTAVATVVLGYLHYLEGGFREPTVTLHMITGTAVAVLAVAAWYLCTRAQASYARVKHVLGAALVVLLFAAGHYGGNLTHGSTYLVEYAPQPIRSLAGLEPRRPRVTSLELADPYLDVVRPALRNRCMTCHGGERREGDLDLTTYDAMMRGGETGRVILPGNAERSELHYRVTLPPDDEAFMPTDGNTPLTTTEVAILRWWIDAGAPNEVTVGELDVPEEVRELLRAWLRL